MIRKIVPIGDKGRIELMKNDNSEVGFVFYPEPNEHPSIRLSLTDVEGIDLVHALAWFYSPGRKEDS